MKPEISSPVKSFEQVNQAVRLEYDNIQEKSLENNLLAGVEKGNQSSETGAMVGDVGLTTSLPQPVIDDKTVATNTTYSDVPALAADDDLIEKEWVEKAKKIISDTKDDPYKQEEAVSRLQVNYLKKRYGREIKPSDK